MSDRMTEAGWFDLEAALVACSRDRIGFGRTKARLKGALSQTKKAFESGDRATCFLRAFGRLWLDAPDDAARDLAVEAIKAAIAAGKIRVTEAA